MRKESLAKLISQYLISENYLGLFKLIQTVDIKVAVSRESRSFNQLINIDGVKKSEVIQLISGMVFSLITQAYNVSEKLNEFQTTIMASRLMEHEEMGIEDAALLIKKGLFGEFGRIYNKFDLDTWDEWINKYLDQRIDESERQQQEKKANLGSPIRDSRVVEMTDKLVVKPGKAPDEKYFKTKNHVQSH